MKEQVMSKDLEPYNQWLKKWPREAGRKPTASDLAAVHATGAVKPGSKDALAVAMSLRGVTQGEVKAVLGLPHRNKIKDLVSKRVAKAQRVPRRDGMKVYKLELVQRAS